MANQHDDNYTKIGNEILEYIPKVKLNGTQRGIITVIWRYTYGFHRDDHDFSLGFLSEATDCDRQQVKRELDKLISERILKITQEADFNNPRRIAFNKDFSQWGIKRKLSAEKTTVSELAYTTVSEKDYTTVSELAYQERKIKERLKKDSASHDQLFEELWKLYPRKKSKNIVKEAQKKKIEVVGFEKMKAAIDNYKKEIESNKTPEKFILHGGRFFNGRYEDYLDENMEPIEELDPTPKTNDLDQWKD